MTEEEIIEMRKENTELKVRLGISEHDREHNDYELSEAYKTIDELKAHCKAVDDVNKKMKCCGNCRKVKYKNPMIENDCTWCINLDKWELI